MNESNELLPFFFTLLGGGLIGFLIYHITLGKSKASEQQKELDKNKIELEKYKAQVNDHFNDSAELMGQVANSYQALYNHMAGQSESLLGDTATTHFPLLKTSDDTDQEKVVPPENDESEEVETTVTEVESEQDEVTVTEVKTEEAETTVTEVKSEQDEVTVTEVKTEEAETTANEVKSEQDESTANEVKSEQAEPTATEVKSEQDESTANEVKKEETK